MRVKDEVFNLVPFDKLIQLTSFLTTVLQLGHFNLVVNLSHLRCVLGHGLDATDTTITLLSLLLVVL